MKNHIKEQVFSIIEDLKQCSINYKKFYISDEFYHILNTKITNKDMLFLIKFIKNKWKFHFESDDDDIYHDPAHNIIFNKIDV